MKRNKNKQQKNNWSKNGGTDFTFLRQLMSSLSIRLREKQYQYFLNLFQVKSDDKILDVGVSPDLTLKDTNFFEQYFPYKRQLTIASVENCSNLVKKYKLAKFIKIIQGKKLPIPDKSFDIVVSWATLEHVGNKSNQAFFLQELCRVGKKIFIITPDKRSIYEPHTSILFLHWLPAKLWRKMLHFLGKDFWAKEENLNILTPTDIREITKELKAQISSFKIFNIFPSHVIIYKRDN